MSNAWDAIKGLCTWDAIRGLCPWNAIKGLCVWLRCLLCCLPWEDWGCIHGGPGSIIYYWGAIYKFPLAQKSIKLSVACNHA